MYKVFWFDLETTGLDKEKNRITEIAVIFEDTSTGKVEEFHQYIKYKEYPKDYAKVAAMTGNTPEFLEEHGIDEETAYRNLRVFMESKVKKYEKLDKMIPAGYNVRFDLEFLNAMFNRYHNKYLFGLIAFLYLDVACKFAEAYIQKLIPQLKNTKLETFKEYFMLEGKSHSGIADIRVTRELFYMLDKMIIEKKLSEKMTG